MMDNPVLPTAKALSTLAELKTLYKEGKYQDVVRESERMLQVDPGNRKVRKLAEKAQQALENVSSKTSPSLAKIEMPIPHRDAAAVSSIDEALYWIATFMERKEYHKALRGCYEILTVDPENTRAKELLEQVKKYTTATDNTTAASTEDVPNNLTPEAVLLENLKIDLGNYMEIGEYDQARKAVSKILEIDQDDGDALQILHQLDQIQERLKQEEQSLETVDFSSLKRWQRLTRLFWMKGNKSFLQGLKGIFSNWRESETEKMKRKALELIKEKKDTNVLALKIQKNIIPQIDKYTLPGFDLWGDTIQSERIGGDNFNFIQRDKENILFYIGDASGHGIQASLFASQVNVILRECVHQGMGLVEMAITLNQRLQAIDSENKNFMTMILLNWNLKQKILSFVGAGHEYIIHYRHEDQKIEMIPAKGIAIGMIQDIAPLLSERQIRVADQDQIVLFTDGVIESELKGKPGELFGMERLNELILKHRHAKDSKEMYRLILQELGEQTMQNDDVTLLILRRDQSTDLIFEDDLANVGIESINLTTLKNLSRAEVERSIREISLENKIKKLLLELDNLQKRGEYQLIVNKCTSAIRDDHIYNKQVTTILKKAKKVLLQSKVRERQDMMELSYKNAQDKFKDGDYLQAKMELLKVLKLDEKNFKIKHLLRRVERTILKKGPRLVHKVSDRQSWSNRLTHYINVELSPPNRKDSLDFIVKLANLVNSGIKVKESLLILTKQAKKEGVKEMYRAMIDNLEKGFLLSFSMAGYPKVFSNLQINLIRAGEESGNLGPILDDLSKQLLEERELKRKIKGALIYPAFIITFSILLVVGMLVGVVPQLAAAYKEANLSLPLPTQIIIGISDFLQNYWYIVLATIVVLTLGLGAFKKTLTGQEVFDRLSLRVPILKDLTSKNNIFLFANSLSMLIDSGILLLDAMSITADVVGNIYYKRDIIRMRTDIVNGQTLSHALGIEALTDKNKKLNTYFPIEVAQMAQVGETTGQISKMLRIIGNNYQNELKQFAKNFSTIIEPVLIVFIGAMVGVLLVAIMLPFFEFGKAIKNL